MDLISHTGTPWENFTMQKASSTVLFSSSTFLANGTSSAAPHSSRGSHILTSPICKLFLNFCFWSLLHHESHIWLSRPSKTSICIAMVLSSQSWRVIRTRNHRGIRLYQAVFHLFLSLWTLNSSEQKCDAWQNSPLSYITNVTSTNKELNCWHTHSEKKKKSVNLFFFDHSTQNRVYSTEYILPT